MIDAAEIEELRASFREVLDDIVASGEIRRHVDAGAARCEPLCAKVAELGWFSLLTPEEHGGLALGRAAAAALYEELGRVTAPLPMATTLVASELIASFGSEAQQTAWLPRLAAGEVATLGASGVASQALRLNDNALTGEVTDLLDAAGAALLVAPVRDGDATRWALVDGAAFASAPLELVDRTRNLGAVSLKGVEVAVLPGDGDAAGRALRIHTAIALACDAVGGAKAVLALTIEYLKTREQFGKPIGSFQALKHRCAEHAVAIEAADALLREAVRLWDADDSEAELYAMLVKSLACEAYADVATDAVQLHGGIGFTWEHVCHLYLKRAKLNQALFGTSAAHLDAAARLLAA
jgi:alkylation response protein AidB-like acyl-CoA dehydrogenase